MRRMIMLVALLLVGASSFPLSAQDAQSRNPASEEMMKDATWSGEKFAALLNAIPDTKLDWRPAEGVRSFRELFTHFADANHFFMTFV